MTAKSARKGAATTGADVDDREEVDVDGDSATNDVAEHDTTGDQLDSGDSEDNVGSEGEVGSEDGVGSEEDELEAAGDADTTDSASAGAATNGLLARRVLYGAAALAIAAFLVAAVFGVMWPIAASGEDASLAASRDDVTDAADDAIRAVTEIDYKDPDQYFERSQAVSTDEFGKQLTQAEDRFRKILSKVKTRVKTDVNDIAVQEINDHEGTAKFLAVVSTHISQEENDGTKVLRLQGQMKRDSDDQEWKLAGMGEVPVVGAGAGQQPNQDGEQADGASQGNSEQDSDADN